MIQKSPFVMRILLISLVMTLLFVGTAMGAVQTLSDSDVGAEGYYKEIKINENSGTVLTDYQVLVQLSGDNFPINARFDGADIQFTDVNGNELSYWIEYWDYTDKSTKIWVKVKTIPAHGTATIRMYYGNLSASSSSNGDSTFEFFDDFDGNYLDTSKWKGATEYASLSNGIITIDGDGTWRKIYSKNTFMPNMAFRGRGNFEGLATHFGFEPDPCCDGRAILYYSGLRTDNGGVVNEERGLYSYNNWYNFDILYISGTSIKLLVDETLKTTHTISAGTVAQSVIMGSYTPGNKFQADWVFVRKYVPSEPSYSVSQEFIEESSTPELILTKSLSQSTITEGDTTTVTIMTENVGEDAMNVEIVDVIPQGFTLVSGSTSQEYISLKTTESRTFQYTIKATDKGRFVTDLATLVYQDEDGNSYSSASNSATITVLVSAVDQVPESKTPGFEIIYSIMVLLAVTYLSRKRM